MKKYFSHIAFFIASFSFINCNQHPAPTKPTLESAPNQFRPGASFSDTLRIETFPIVVFYNPDSAQLTQIKKRTKESVFESQAHQFLFQIRNARFVLKRDWPRLPSIETHHARYILFQNTSHEQYVVDLNTFEDFSGMILWDGAKKPHQIDMMNVETELSYYFKMP